MKISNITAYPVEIPLIPYGEGGISPYETSCGITESAKSVLVAVETDAGIRGWGEINMVLEPQTMKSIIEKDLGEKIIGKDPLEIKKIINTLAFNISSQYFNAPAFVAGIEVACWDILGRALEKPIYSLLGGKVRDLIPISYCLGIFDPPKSAARAEEVVAQGFCTLKTKSGKNMDLDIRRIAALREGGGCRLNLRVDPNQAYTAAEAIEFLSKTEEFDLQYIEQPLAVGSFGDLAQLRSRTRTPIAVNEDCYLEGNVLGLIKRDAIDVAVVDHEPLGGVLRMVEFGGLARMANLPLAHHCGFDLGIKTAAILQTTCSIEGFKLAMDSTYYAHTDDVLTERLEITDGSFSVPDGPGLGVEVDDDRLKEYVIC